MKKQKITVLVCEDNALMLQGLRVLLEQYVDLDVVGLAKNGTQAVSQARELQPDVILMDLQMPELDGIAATKIIKAERPFVRIIVVSAVQDENTLKEISECGADGFYPKPVMNSEELYWTIKKALAN